MFSTLYFTRQKIGEAGIAATLDMQTGIARVGGMSARKRVVSVFGLGVLIAALASTVAVAGNGCGTATGTGPITTLFSQLTWFVIAIGGVGSVLVGVFGAIMIMFSAGNSERASKGMTIVKNAIIGLAIMGGIFLIREAVSVFVGGASAAGTAAKTDCGSNLQTPLVTTA